MNQFEIVETKATKSGLDKFDKKNYVNRILVCSKIMSIILI